MDRHSLLSALPFLVPTRCSGNEELEDSLLADPDHVVLRDHELSVEVDGGVAFFDASGVASNNDPGMSSCHLYLKDSQLGLLLAGRLYFVDWSQILDLTVVPEQKQGDHRLRPPSLLMRFKPCSFRIFSLQSDAQNRHDKYQFICKQLTDLMADDTSAGPTFHPNLEPVSCRKGSSSATSTNSHTSPAGHEMSSDSISKQKCLEASHRGLQSLVSTLETPFTATACINERDVFNLLNTVADDLSNSYSDSARDFETSPIHQCTGHRYPEPEVWNDYFPAPRSKTSSSSSISKEQALQVTCEWMREQKRLAKERHELLCLPSRG